MLETPEGNLSQLMRHIHGEKGRVMKRFMMIVVAVMSAGNAWAFLVDDPCRVYEYQEMNAMTDQELTREIDLTRKKVSSNLKYGNNMASQSGPDTDREAQNAYKNARICGEQSSRLSSVKNQRPDHSPMSERSYEDIVKEFYLQNFHDTSLYERIFKHNEKEDGVKPPLLTLPKN